jgi:hypothetical protein
MGLYINVTTVPQLRQHLFVGVGDSRVAFCGITLARWENDYKRVRWHHIKRASGNPAVTCKLCLDALAGRNGSTNPSTSEETT